MISPAEKNALLHKLKDITAFIESLPTNKQCHNCCHFEEGNKLCNAYMQKPPQHIIESGCESWEWDHIPF